MAAQGTTSRGFQTLGGVRVRGMSRLQHDCCSRMFYLPFAAAILGSRASSILHDRSDPIVLSVVYPLGSLARPLLFALMKSLHGPWPHRYGKNPGSVSAFPDQMIRSDTKRHAHCRDSPD
ncbi:hypothetical protein An13g02900 [Aspergillus niger]|uniref:Uncharacterized protein n=2 Tax=Aspergillus niger TaxID=5061 RepID=A2R1Y6_ASPNC|nr:hypothetical protein An13g02900 [Aspergillus niger]CAK41686.1 hypothetical protein An13g02900 [Aspergillus niger]